MRSDRQNGSARERRAHAAGKVTRLGVAPGESDHVVALAGNPNTGKSTVFNALTGLRQHTGNWPGKTVTRAEGRFAYAGARFKLVDLPGTYSLLATSPDEEVARNFLLFEGPDVTVIVVDAARLERNLSLVLQVMEITSSVVVCLNLIDEARRHGIRVDDQQLARDLGVPVVPTVARRREGIEMVVEEVHRVATGTCRPQPKRVGSLGPELEAVLGDLVPRLESRFPELDNARWIALRLLDGDPQVTDAVASGILDGTLRPPSSGPEVPP